MLFHLPPGRKMRIFSKRLNKQSLIEKIKSLGCYVKISKKLSLYGGIILDAEKIRSLVFF